MVRPTTNDQSVFTIAPLAFRIINNQDTDLIINYEKILFLFILIWVDQNRGI